MFRKFIWLEWKAFFRASSLQSNIVIKILTILVALYFTLAFLAMGVGAYYIIADTKQDPLLVVNKYLIYYVLADLVMRGMLQKLPIINIRPLLTLPIKRGTVIHFAMGKTFVSFFTIMHAFFFLPFSIVLIKNGYSPLNVLFWFVSMWAFIYCNNL